MGCVPMAPALFAENSVDLWVSYFHVLSKLTHLLTHGPVCIHEGGLWPVTVTVAAEHECALSSISVGEVMVLVVLWGGGRNKRYRLMSQTALLHELDAHCIYCS